MARGSADHHQPAATPHAAQWIAAALGCVAAAPLAAMDGCREHHPPSARFDRRSRRTRRRGPITTQKPPGRRQGGLTSGGLVRFSSAAASWGLARRASCRCCRHATHAKHVMKQSHNFLIPASLLSTQYTTGSRGSSPSHRRPFSWAAPPKAHTDIPPYHRVLAPAPVALQTPASRHGPVALPLWTARRIAHQPQASQRRLPASGLLGGRAAGAAAAGRIAPSLA